ncbi:MAG TPA: CHASE3 domain-containing protein [Ktedonobacterales bacterium]|nr:CHASE3 domain-containing protein [Ktedonobacterales bacterium]
MTQPVPDAPRPRSELWVALGCALLLLLLVINSLVAFTNIQSLVDREHLVTHTQTILTRLETLQSTLDDAESSERGYILTGQESYLAPYNQARAGLPERLEDLQLLTAGEPGQQARLAQLRALITNKFDELQSTIDLRRNNQTDEAIQIVLSGRGEDTTNAIHSIIGQMEQTEDTLLTQRSAAARATLEGTSITFIVATLADIALLVIVFWLFRRALTQRTQVAAERERLLQSERGARLDAVARARELEVVFDAVTDLVSVYDATGKLVQYNAAANKLMGLNNHPEHVALPLEERAARLKYRDEQGNPLPPERLPQRRFLKGETLLGAEAVDFQMRTLDGREVQFNVSGGPLRDEDGSIVGAVAVYRDVTERRRLERRTHETLDALLEMAAAVVAGESLPGALVVPTTESLSRAGGVARRLAELTCSVLDCERVSLAVLDPEQNILRPVAVVGLSPEQEQQWWIEQEQQQTPLSENPMPDMLARFLGGETLLIDLREPPFNEAPNPYGVLVMLAAPMLVGQQFVGVLSLDYGGKEHAYTEQEIMLAGAVAKLAALVFERERLVRERAEAQANELALLESNRQMDTFLSMASHELKTPLTSMKLHLQLAQRRVRALGERQPATPTESHKTLEQLQDQFTRSHQQVERLDRLVNDLLDVSRIQAGHLEMRPEPTDLLAIVREQVEELRQVHTRRSIRLHISREQPAPIVADAERIGQVVTNFLTNALKYSPETQPVEVGIDIDEGQARVWVRDAGPGIPAEEQERIWERFHRVAGIAVQSGSGVGLGLGLHISKTIIEEHQGQVGVESAPGQGSTFWFTLPLDG